MKRIIFKVKNKIISLTIAALIMPQLAHAGAKVGDQFGDWIYECTALAENKTVCSLSQTIMSKNQNKRIVKFNLARNETTKTVELVATLPLGINLSKGASVSVDSGKVYPLILKTCIQQGCIAAYTVDSNFLKALQEGQKLIISFAFLSGEPITINGSTKGLAEGIKAANLN